MPSATNSVGLLQLPLPAGVLNTAIDDPILTGLIDYLAFWLRASLNTKLSNLQGTAADAVPVTNRFPWDPATYFVRGEQDGATNPFPALYCWWQGRGVRERLTIIKSIRRRELGVCWVFDELVLPGALVDRYGLTGAADAAIQSALEHGYHPGYGYNGAPLGTAIAVSLGLAAWGVRYESGQQGLMSPIPGQGAVNSGTQAGRAEGHVVRAYPCVNVTLNVWEPINQFEADDPGDVAPAILVGLRANAEGGVDDADEVAERYLDKPDGTEDSPSA